MLRGIRLVDVRTGTCMAAQVDLEPAGLVVSFVAAWERAAVLACLSEVGSVVREQCAEGDECLLTA